MGYTICDAAAAHLPQLAALARACFSAPWTRAQLAGQLPDDRHVFLIAAAGETVLGYANFLHVLDAGDIGKVVLVRSYTQDPRTTIEGTLKFAPHSGGQYLDMCVHDLDLIRWFTGAEVKRVWAIGGVFEFDLYRELNDADNCCATVQLDNGAMGFMFTNRTHGAGCNVETEIIGTHGTLRIANVGAKNLLQIVDGSGAREEYSPDFLSRWHQAYINEIQEFVACINEGRKAGITVYDGTKASQAAYRCKESFETGEMLVIE